MVVLGILVLTAGFGATIVAFGGQAWIEGNSPVLKRITVRGWLSILFLVLALALGVSKEFLSASQEAVRSAADATKEGERLARESALKTELVASNRTLELLKGQLNAANAALQQTNTLTAEIADLSRRINAEVDLGAEQLDAANKSLSKSGELVRDIAELQLLTKNATLLNVLSRKQAQFALQIAVPLDLTQARRSKELVDSLFPSWRRDGVQDGKKLLITFEANSRTRALSGSFWGFRETPYKLVSIGTAEGHDPLAHDLTMHGAVYLSTDGKTKSILSATYKFPSSQVPSQWLAEFRVGTQLFTASIGLRTDLPESHVTALATMWHSTFGSSAALRIPLLEEDSFFMEYDLERGDVFQERMGDLLFLSIPYSIVSSPAFRTENL